MKITNYILSFRELPYPIIRSWVIGVVVCLSFVLPSTLTVPTDYPNIQAGIDASTSGDTVLVLDGVYSGEGNTNISYVSNGDSLILISENGYSTTIIDCENNGKFATFGGSPTVSLIGFTFKNANSSVGALEFYSGLERISSCLFLNNHSSNGGAISTHLSSSTIISNCVFYGNTSVSGGTDINNGIGGGPQVYNSILSGTVGYGEHGISIYYSLVNNNIPFYDEGSFLGDPLFVDPESNQFELQLTSPCINAGSPAFPLDPDGSMIDIGISYYPLPEIGDCNFDGEINVLDVAVLVTIILEPIPIYNALQWVADLNQDEEINVIDIIIIINQILY